MSKTHIPHFARRSSCWDLLICCRNKVMIFFCGWNGLIHDCDGVYRLQLLIEEPKCRFIGLKVGIPLLQFSGCLGCRRDRQCIGSRSKLQVKFPLKQLRGETRCTTDTISLSEEEPLFSPCCKIIQEETSRT